MIPPDLRAASRSRVDYRASWSTAGRDLALAQQRIVAATRELDGWLLEADTLKLVELAYHCGDSILEIGTWAGRSCVVELLGALAAPARRQRPQLVGIDVAPEAIDATYRTLALHGLATDAALYRGTLAEMAREHAVAPTMVFVDGGHRQEEVREDLDTLVKMVAPGVPVFGHDYTNPENDTGRYGVRRAFDDWEAAGYGDFIGLFGCGALYVASSRCRGARAAALDREAFARLRRTLRGRHDPVRRLAAEGFRTVRAGFAPQPLAFALGTGFGPETIALAGRQVAVEWIRSPALLLVENLGSPRKAKLRLDLGRHGSACDVALEHNGELHRRLFEVPRPLWEGAPTRAEWKLTLHPGDNVLRLLDHWPPAPLPDGRAVSWLVLGEPVIEAE